MSVWRWLRADPVVETLPAGPRPAPGWVRVDARVCDDAGAACTAWVVLLAPGTEPLFDDPAVSQALRMVLAGPMVDAVSTLTRDTVHWAGAITVVRDGRSPLGDPFARLGPQRLFAVPAGVLGVSPLTIGPVTQRYGGAPWPVDRF